MGVVLSGGKKLIKRMRDAVGDGEPELAESFGHGARQFKLAQQTLAKAHPGQQWEGGTASAAYNERTGDQENRVATLGDTDSEIATIVSREAERVRFVRKVLDYNLRLLDDVGKRTWWLSRLGPEGKLMQADIEAFYVAMAMEQCVPTMWQMHNDANANAAAIRALRDEYQRLAARVVISDSSNDFDPTGPPR